MARCGTLDVKLTSEHTIAPDLEVGPLPGDRFVPLPIDAMIHAIAADPERFAGLCGLVDELEEALEHVFEQEASVFRRRLWRKYEVLNPARETIAPADAQARNMELGKAVDQLRGMAGYLLDKANYEHFTEAQLQATIGMASSHGMQIEIDPSRISCLDLYVRGRSRGQRWVKTWRHPWQGEARSVDQYRRLAVVFQLAESPHLNLKLFRDIPISDVESLLPHAEVKMSTWDRTKIAGGALGALGGLATKLWTWLVYGEAMGTHFTWVLFAALLGLSVRSFFGYRQARTERTSQMTHHLYYQAVANNAGVVGELLGSIAQEELKEALLAFALGSDPSITSRGDLKSAVEVWLEEAFDVDVDFDVDDALESLDRFGLWADREHFVLLPPEEAVVALDQHWQARASRGYHIDAWERTASAGASSSSGASQ